MNLAPNNMMCPIRMVPMAPMAQQGMPMPITINIDFTPAAQNSANNGVLYNVPQVSVYQAGQNAADVAKSMAAQVGVKSAEAKPQENSAKVETKPEAKPEPKTEQPKVEVKHNKPEIVAPEPVKNAIDINGLVEILNSSDYEEQADAMEAISEVAMYAPERAGELLDKKVVDTLSSIMDKDTAALQGEDKKLADRNKEYAMFTTATLQKLYSDEVKKEGNVVVPTEDLIGIKSIVKNLATNPNASVREAAVASLGYVNRPEHKDNLSALLQVASQDSDASVRAQADKQLQKVLG